MKHAGCLSCSERDLARRDFLRIGSLSLLGISLAQYLEFRSVMAAGAGGMDQKAKAESCILLWLEGGPSHIDTWDPKPNSSFKPIASNIPGIQISELLPRVAKQMDKLAIIRSMHTQEINHPQATYEALTGHRPNSAMLFPSFGSIITREMGPKGSFPPHVLVPEWTRERQYEKYFGPAFIGSEYAPMVVPDPSGERFKVADLRLPKSVSLERIQHRRSFLEIWDRYHRQRDEIAQYAAMDSYRAQALNMILSPAVREAFDLSKESDSTKEAYGKDSFGQSVLLARRLVESGSRFVTAAGYHGNSWDAHSNNDKRHRDALVPPLDRALSTLLLDLDQRGLLESTVVLAMGEFGRTPEINPDGGRDHWPYCWSLVIGGGGLAVGQVVGASDERGASGDRRITMGDLFATIYKAMGIDWHKEYMHPIGRPVKIANSIDGETGRPIPELI